MSRHDLRRTLKPRRVDLADLCREAVTSARVRHPEHPVRLLVAPGDHTVRADTRRLRRVIANLLATPADTHRQPPPRPWP